MKKIFGQNSITVMHSDLKNLKQTYRCCVDEKSKAITHLKCKDLIQNEQHAYR